MTAEYSFTPDGIKRTTGFTLAVVMPRWQTDGAALAGYHDEHERLTKEFGWENVIGSLCVEEGNLVLGIFVKHSDIVDARVIEKRRELPSLTDEHSFIPAYDFLPGDTFERNSYYDSLHLTV